MISSTSSPCSVIIHTDGSCLGNPGPGGYAAILRQTGKDYEKSIGGGFARTTNNRMEITAVIEALSSLNFPCRVDLYSDSQYVINAIEKRWLVSWLKKGWINSKKEPVKNRDLWEKLLPLLERHEVKFHWVRGHQGHAENEKCDQMAREWAARPGLPEDIGLGEGKGTF